MIYLIKSHIYGGDVRDYIRAKSVEERNTGSKAIQINITD